MKIAFRLIFLFLLFSNKLSYSQSLQNFYDMDRDRKYYIGIASNHIANESIDTLINEDVFDVWATYPEIGRVFRKDGIEKGCFHYDFRTRLYQDLMGLAWTLLSDMIFRNDNPVMYYKMKVISNGILTHGLIGSHNFGINITGSQKLVISSGVNLSDYMYHLSNYNADGGQAAENGYYFALGPYMNIDLLISDNIMFRMAPRFDFPFFHPDKRPDFEYNPFFSFTQFELNHLCGLMFRIDLYNMLHTTDVSKFGKQTFTIAYKF